MPALITLTLNPALDLATTTYHVAPTHKLRCGPVQRFAGGGGINVARVLHRLGADVCAWALAGGAAGTQVRQLLAAEGVPTLLQPISGDTRENFSVVETTTSQEFRFVLPGPTLQASEWQACLDALATHTPPPRWLIASGSLPPGTPDDFYAQLARAVAGRGLRVAVDTSGPPLAAALQAGVALVKPSLRELRDVMQKPLEHAADWCTAAQSLVHSGAADIVALSVGEQGAVLATREGVWQAPALNVPATTGTTGAGDCFLAALVWALDRGDAPAEALRWGVAAGAAALLHPGTALAQADDVRRLVRSVPAPMAFTPQP
ncbi:MULTISPECIES: 1-phosphofructokinase family hexose kinase [unclassified Acidovorax]|uniref:1-phosphofructokinase family hexose kinase n=1 Tax=unclassified Acidovorax TaxID=2684926 RepID=UPI001C45D640|nr:MULTISPECIES: 1-phosphofructokinase family hexose kinase [unclassified Acidovorax]MBV7462509.1 1-phosphofructokinase family hexose kinase [Acidovorax sp. sif0632]MBV7467398.1 1-phosphofructokinase family hexose kinase [Acidovorax sp. sif0613]